MRAVTRRILKFGGTSVATPAAVQSVLEIVSRTVRESSVVVVVSAIAGITDRLEKAVAHAGREQRVPELVDSILDPYDVLLRASASGRLRDDAAAALAERGRELTAALDEIARHGTTPARRDAVLAAGERLSVAVITAALRAGGIDAFPCDATELIRTDATFGEAEVDLPSTRRQAQARLGSVARWTVPVITGFIGAAPTGETTVLGRGGSDYSAALLGWALDADRVEIWSDVDGIMTADPRVVRGARPLLRLSYREATTLAEAGARVLHPRTLQPLERAGIPVLVRNTFRPEAPGTRVGRDPEPGSHPRAAIASRLHDGVAHLLVLDQGGAASERPARVRAALRAAGVEPRAVTSIAGDLAVRVVVDAPLHLPALRAIHDRVVAPEGRVNVVLAGPRGRVASALLAQLARHEAILRDRTGVDLRLMGVFDRERAAWCADGLWPLDVPRALERGERTPWPESVARVCRSAAERVVFVDGTASAELADCYQRLLEAGVGIATPNKIANSRGFAEYTRLRQSSADGVPYRYSTTVGAGLPVLRTIRELTQSGDRLRSFTAVLSGTLSYVIGRVQEGMAFTSAVADAQRLGLTEPDPRIDLSGEDVARKLLVVLREAGIALERGDLDVTSLVPQAGEDVDARWARAAETARARGERLVHVARWEGQQASVGVIALPANDPVARAEPGENVVRIRTDRYLAVPLTLAGPGAGPDLTAGNLLADVVSAAQALLATAERESTDLSPAQELA